MTEVFIQPDETEAGWKLDQQAIEEAAEELGIKNRILIGYMPCMTRYGGNVAAVSTSIKNLHIVLLTDCLHIHHNDPKRISFVLWHEFTHLMQAEREGHKEFMSCYNRYGNVLADGNVANYKRNPYEVEANLVAKANAHVSLVNY